MKRFPTRPVGFALLGLLIAVGLPATASAQADGEPAKAEPVKAEPTKAAPISPAKATPTQPTPTVRPLSVTVGLISESEIEGTLTDTTQLQMQTSFGTASIPLSEVAGIRFASTSDTTTTVVMMNGDSITGATDVKLITVETEWGTASINGPSIKSIMFVPGLAWNPQTGLNGKRWSLTDAKVQPTPAPPAAAVAPATGAAAAAPARSSQPASAPARSNAFPSTSGSFNSSGQFVPNR